MTDKTTTNVTQGAVIVDPAVLMEIFDGRVSATLDAYDDFLAASTEFLLFAAVHRKEGNANGVGQAMSDLKYAAVYIGANPLFEAAKECEIKVLNGSFTDEDMRQLSVALDTTTKYVTEQRDMLSERQSNTVN